MKKNILLYLFLSLGLVTGAQVNLNKGLIAYYPFSGTAEDMSGNDINGIVKKASKTTDRNGEPNSAYYFNGSSYIQLPFSSRYDFGPHDSFSISVWIMPDQNNKIPAQALIVKSPFSSNHTQAQWNYGIYTVNYKAMTGYADTHVLQSDAALPKNENWYHITSTYNNGVWKLYINCQLEKQDLSKTKFILQDGHSKIFFGKKGEADGDWFKGKMDEVRIYNRELSAAEIVSLCNIKEPVSSNEPSADFTYTITNCNAVQFKISTSENIKSFKWDLGDNATAAKESFTHLYKKDGSYVVKLIATGSNGKEITITKNFTITKPTAAFTYEKATEKNTFNFNIDNKQKLQYKWFFGDGTTSDKEKKVTHTYLQPGNYDVLLIAENKNGCSDTAIQTITIAALPPVPAKDTIVTIPVNNDPATALIKQRENNLLKEIEVTGDSLSVSFYDNAEIDGDSVTIVFNDKIITTHLFLTDKPKTFILPVNTNGQPNELIMYAENLGSIPPNTALMIVYDGNKRHEVSISSSKTSNGMVRFIFKR
ncbi:PKD domain-containing protein [Ferruginibacter sp. SUN106]|uniref:PKD domain-containing protein n=1 Tax=Ferruginibacter sp. SUN106 TaxID=2978348 RepID=UPI003D36B834